MPGTMPRLGLGTAVSSDYEGRREAVRTALEIGYRHVDTAQVYDTEEYVGQGIADSDVPREGIFLATKTVHHDIPGPDAGDIHDAVDGCLDRLGTDYVDLLYVHWPTGVYDPAVTLPAFDRLRDEGTIRHVGLSNFEPDQLAEARDHLDAPVFAHQVEMHPLLHQDDLLADAQEHDHWLVAYSPLAQGEVFDEPVIGEIAEKHGATPAQVSLAWLLSKDNVAAIPQATGRDHIQDNWDAQDLSLDDEDVARIDAIDREVRTVDPDRAPWNR